MIDWLTASRCASVLLDDPERTAVTLADVITAAPCFQNTEFPLSPLPLYARHDQVAGLVPVLERYVTLLGRIVTLFREHERLRDWYRLGPAAEALVDADTRLGDVVPVCRLDGYLARDERLVLLENNADAPAGTLFSPRVNGVVREALHRLGAPAPAWSPLTFASETALLDVLVTALRAVGMADAEPRVGVLQFADTANRESHEMVRAFRRAGVFATIADPRDIRVAGDRVWFGDAWVNVCWNKVNTVGWRAVVDRDGDLVRRWVEAVGQAGFAHVNPFGTRYVAESKFTLALPREPQFADLFTAEERAVTDELLPWARRLTRTALAADDQTPLAADVLDHPADYVLKQPYDIRGDGVVVGRSMSRGGWERAVEHALEHGLVAQRHVTSSAYPVIQAGSPGMVCMPVSFDTFVFGGRVAGFGAKASLNPKVNVFQGGQKLAVHVTAEG